MDLQFNSDAFARAGITEDHPRYAELRQFLSALYYVRVAPGTVYVKSLQAFTGRKDILRLANSAGIPFLLIESKDDTDSSYDPVVTNTEHRFLLDLLIHCFILTRDRFFNPMLYVENITRGERRLHEDGDDVVFDLHYEARLQAQEIEKLFDGTEELYKTLFRAALDSAPRQIRFHKAEITPEVTDYSDSYLDGDAIKKLQDPARDHSNPLTLCRCCFGDDVFLSDLTVCGGIDASKSIFLGAVQAESAVWKPNWAPQYGIPSRCVNLRECVFCGSFLMQDIQVENEGRRAEITFEDARFLPGAAQLAFNECDFSNTKINCYQTLFGETEISFVDCELSDCTLDFSGSFMYNRLLLRNIKQLSKNNFSFEIGNALLLDNCEIHDTMLLKNVFAFRLQQVKRFSTISTDPLWSFEDNMRRLQEAGVQVSRKATWHNTVKDTANLLKACSNPDRRSLAEQYLILRGNYQEQGDFDYEDQAFLLYMRNRKVAPPIRAVFTLLDLLGHYGLSPGRVCFGYLVLCFIVLVVYLIHGWADSCPNVQNFGNAVYQALLYSIALDGIDECSFCRSVSVVQGYIGWFLTGYFSVAIINKTLRS